MDKLIRSILRFLKAEDGPTAVEYAVMLALIIVVAASAVQSIGDGAYQSFWVVVEALD
ncbi:MAG: Flp family type IVb pilin [Planctomycetota bacterium]